VDTEPEDTELEEELRQLAARMEPVPPRLIQAAIDSFTWRTIDADLAELVFDSVSDRHESALVRGSRQDRLLSFRAGEVTIELEVTVTGSTRGLTGQIAPPQPAVVQIRHSDGEVTVAADELGCFCADSLSAGPVRLRCSLAAAGDGPAVVTDWVPI
jgi:hypothetical protein